MTKFYQMNDFYRALISLEKFETGNTDNSYFNAPTIFALHRIVALFDNATEKGDVIAPFFLHHLHQKYPDQIDDYYLPNLDVLPTHRSQAKEWVNAYDHYIKIRNQIQNLPDDLIILAKSERDGRKKEKALKAKHKKVKSEISQLDKFDTPIAKMLIAKSQQNYCSLDCVRAQRTPNDHRTLNEALEVFYREAAEVPNYWAMLEYVDFMEINERTPINIERHTKIIDELNIIHAPGGNFYTLFTKYENEANQRAQGQWLIHSALHGEEQAIVRFYRMYCEPRQVWKKPIDFPEALAQARLWADVIYRTENIAGYTELWKYLKNQILGYLEAPHLIKNRKKYISHLVRMTYQVIEMAPKHVTEDGRDIYQLKEFLLDDFCQQYDDEFPLFAYQNKHISTELALTFERKKRYPIAQKLFQYAYQVEPKDPITQYNLANVLFSQSQNHNLEKQIELFTKAAKSGCQDSATRLVFLTVFKHLDFDVDLEHIYKLLEKNLEDTVDGKVGRTSIPLPKEFLLSMMKIKIEDTVRENIEFTLDDIVTSIETKYSSDFEISQQVDLQPTEPSFESVQQTQTEATSAFFQPIVKPKKEKRISPKCKQHNKLLATDIAQESNQLSPFTPQMSKALKTLETIANKSTRSLNGKDLVSAQKSMHILNGGNESDFKVSNKGRTSGSRVRYGNNTKTYHLPHGKGDMIIGAKADLKSDISATLSSIGIK